MTPAAKFELRQLANARDLLSQGEPLNVLLRRTGLAPPFFSPEWFDACLRAYGKNKEAALLLALLTGELKGVAPLWRYRHVRRRIPLRTLGFIAVHDSPFVDFVVGDADRETFLNSVLRALFDAPTKPWDLLRLSNWPVKSPNRPFVERWLQQQKKKFRFIPSSVAPVLFVCNDWDDFLKSRSAKFRKTRRNIINRVRQLEDLEVECHRSDLTGSVLKDVVTVTQRSWKWERGITMTQQQGALEFFRLFTKNASAHGWPMIWLLKTKGTPIAMEYDLECNGIVHALRADYDQGYARLSPGAYLEYEIIERLFRGGFREYRPGPGLNDYKLRWTTQMQRNETLLVYNTTPRGMLAYAADTLVDRAKHKVLDLRRQAPAERSAG